MKRQRPVHRATSEELAARRIPREYHDAGPIGVVESAPTSVGKELVRLSWSQRRKCKTCRGVMGVWRFTDGRIKWRCVRSINHPPFPIDLAKFQAFMAETQEQTA